MSQKLLENDFLILFLTCVSLTKGSISLPEMWLTWFGEILGTRPIGNVTPVRASGLSWDPGLGMGCSEMGLWGPLLDPEEDLRLINAISTVGSGL